MNPHGPATTFSPGAPWIDQPVTCLRGVGLERASQLARLDIHTLDDLLLYRPRHYDDRRLIQPVQHLRIGDTAAVQGRNVAQGVKRWSQRRRSVFELILEDGTGRLHCRWWNLPYMENQFQIGDSIVAFGRLRSLKPPAMDHPETEIIGDGEESSIHLHRVVPIYALTEGLSQRWLRALVWHTLHLPPFDDAIPSPWTLPGNWPSRSAAIRQLHFPEDVPDAESARRRLALDELCDLQSAIRKRRQRMQEKATSLPCQGDNRYVRPFLARLGFKLTEPQTRVLRQLREDLGGRWPMRRLLQGDVGSGKTVVAACAALMTLESGFDVAFMAPTEILTEQHARLFARWFRPLGIPVQLRTGACPQPQNLEPDLVDTSAGVPLAGPEHPRAALHIGTHALLESAFAPPKLGLVIIDEQHKFGVAQREQLVRKGPYPHLLVMTATPIPRTLGLTVYGDLDVSTIEAPPAGRGRVRTFVRGPDRLPRVWAFLRDKLAQGRQAFIVYPRLEEDDPKAGLTSLLGQFENLGTTLAPFRVGLVHGRLTAQEKEQVMTDFRQGRLSVLAATSVIEVGIDVPNATVMVIESAESYGLAQLHQLRGRIGRGPQESWCVLVSNARTAEARQRLRVLEQTTDGFRIAEADLQLRGPGELLGQAQSGVPRMRFADLASDLDLVQLARQIVATASPGSSPSPSPSVSRL